ncbi:hypothetical protein IMSAG013_01369 [Clostridiales bacterium]|nr:hypothetical protein IMSAG013_01369 [Clostridiales bacterium]
MFFCLRTLLGRIDERTFTVYAQHLRTVAVCARLHLAHCIKSCQNFFFGHSHCSGAPRCHAIFCKRRTHFQKSVFFSVGCILTGISVDMHIQQTGSHIHACGVNYFILIGIHRRRVCDFCDFLIKQQYFTFCHLIRKNNFSIYNTLHRVYTSMLRIIAKSSLICYYTHPSSQNQYKMKFSPYYFEKRDMQRMHIPLLR